MRQHIVFACYLLVLLLPLLELSLRLIQYAPYQHTPFHIESSPTYSLLPHPQYGFGLNPGRFEVNINHGLTYEATHGEDSLRITSNKPFTIGETSIFVMGCSYSYGIGVNDRQTFAYCLQSLLPTYQIQNRSVPGYGTVQSYLQLQQAIDQGNIPSYVVIAYADFHNERNSLSPSYRKTLQLGYERSQEGLSSIMQPSRIPYVDLNNKRFVIGWENWKSMYHNWHGRESWSSINFLQNISDRFSAYQLNSKARNLYIFQQIQAICQVYNIHLLVVGLTSSQATQETLTLLQSIHIETLDISLDLSNSFYNNYPFDSHPNAIAHQEFALRLYQYFDQ